MLGRKPTRLWGIISTVFSASTRRASPFICHPIEQWAALVQVREQCQWARTLEPRASVVRGGPSGLCAVGVGAQKLVGRPHVRTLRAAGVTFRVAPLLAD